MPTSRAEPWTPSLPRVAIRALVLWVSTSQFSTTSDLAGGQLRGQRVAQGGAAGPLGEGVIVAAGLGAVDGAAALPERGADGADPGAAGALLLPELAAGAGDFPLGLGLGGAGAALGQVVADRFPDQVLVDVLELEDFGQQVDGADLGVVQVQ